MQIKIHSNSINFCICAFCLHRSDYTFWVNINLINVQLPEEELFNSGHRDNHQWIIIWFCFFETYLKSVRCHTLVKVKKTHMGRLCDLWSCACYLHKALSLCIWLVILYDAYLVCDSDVCWLIFTSSELWRIYLSALLGIYVLQHRCALVVSNGGICF